MPLLLWVVVLGLLVPSVCYPTSPIPPISTSYLQQADTSLVE